MNPPAIVILGEARIPVACQIQTAIPEAVIYGLGNRTQSADATYDNFAFNLCLQILPISNRHRLFFRDIGDRQVDHFHGRFIRGEGTWQRCK